MAFENTKTKFQIISFVAPLAALLLFPTSTAKDTLESITIKKSSPVVISDDTQVQAHGMVLKLADGSTCLLTNEHVEAQFGRAVRLSPPRITVFDPKPQSNATYDLEIIEIGGKSVISCPAAFLRLINFRTNQDLITELKSNPKLFLQTSVTLNTIRETDYSSSDKETQTNTTSEEHEILFQAYSPDLNWLIYTSEPKFSPVRGTSGSPILNPSGEIVAIHKGNIVPFDPRAYEVLFENKTGQQLVSIIKRINEARDLGEDLNIEYSEEAQRLHAPRLLRLIAKASIDNPKVLDLVEKKDSLGLMEVLFDDTIKEFLELARENLRQKNKPENALIADDLERFAIQLIETARLYKQLRPTIYANFEGGRSTFIGVPVTTKTILGLKENK